jgi:hypothetical protein
MALLKRPSKEGDRVVNLGLIHQTHAMAGSGFETDSQQGRDLLGGGPLADQIQNLKLTGVTS